MAVKAFDMSKPADVRRALNSFGSEVQEIEGKNLQGMIKAGYIIERKSKETTPYQTGHLESSHYVSHNNNPKNPIVEVGLTAKYAPFVHENTSQKVKKDGRRPLFLALAIIENKDLILATIRRAIRV